LVAVALVAVRLVIVVVASVVSPNTTNAPEVVPLPFSSIVKFRFSVHADPFQYSVELVAVPSATTPSTVAQKVEVPEVDRNCPNVSKYPKIFTIVLSLNLRNY
jgi:hypothetical protein